MLMLPSPNAETSRPVFPSFLLSTMVYPPYCSYETLHTNGSRLILIAIHFYRSKQMRERELSKLPLAVFLYINLGHHEGIGNFVCTDYCLQIEVLKQDGCVTKHASINCVNESLFVPDAAALDRCEFLGFSPGPPHVGEHRFVIKQRL